MTAGVGHNSNVARKELENFVKRVENLIDQRKAINGDITDVMEEAKGKGFDKRGMREMIRLRALDVEKRKDQENIRDAYLVALGLE